MHVRDHRGSPGDPHAFAKRFILCRLEGFEKDIRICLTPHAAKARSGLTHAYFPALATCCATLEYLTALHRGNIRGIGWPHVADWAKRFLPQPDYDRDTVRVLFDAFRHSVAHRGIASGVWIDQNRGPGHGRRLTWAIHANSRRPPCRLVPEDRALVRDPPWPCRYTHRVHIHLKGLANDIRKGAVSHATAVGRETGLLENFMACMQQLYPR